MPKKKTAGPSSEKTETIAPKKALKTPKSSVQAASEKTTAITIDYPLSGEIITSQVYTIRITARDPGAVEISFDGTSWIPARESVGHWWYDWSGYRAGGQTLIARMKSAAGRSVKTKPRQFTVIA